MQYLKILVEWSGGHSTTKGNRGKDELPQAKTRRLHTSPWKASDYSAMKRTSTYIYLYS